MELMAEQAKQDDGSERVMLVGFRQDECDAFAECGVDVRALVRVLDRGEKPRPMTMDTYDHYAVVRSELDAPMRPDFPAALRRQLYANAFQLYRRHHSRTAFARHNALRSWTHVDNLFHIAANLYFDILRRNGITTVCFSNFPHEGSFIILYHLCRLLGIQTILTTQSAFSGRLWIVRGIEDFGVFDTVAGEGRAEPAPSAPTTPFYMKGRTKHLRALTTGARVLSESAKIALKVVSLKVLFDPHSVNRNMNRLVQARDRLRIGNLSPGDVSTADLDAPYVYFPLHLQPEMTTDTWGLDYGDQLLAIEELAAALPEGMYLYLKENPIQTSYMREASFFRRLRAIPNVKYVPPDLSTFELIRKSRCVATITGTAGWEAALLGKGCIHFGVTWYSMLPGVYRWTGPDTLTKALAVTPDRALFEERFEAMTGKLYSGVIDKVYGKLIPGYDRQAETRRAVRSFVAVMREGPPARPSASQPD